MSSSSTSLSSSSSEPLDLCADGRRRIKLVPSFQKNFVANRTTGYRLQVVAETACRMETAIFRFLRRPPDARGETYDEFSGICSAADLEEFPVDEPSPTADPPVFRSDTIDLVFRSQSECDELWELIQEEVSALRDSLDSMDTLVAADPVWVGGAP